MSLNAIVGANQGTRKDYDFYPTPPEVTYTLLEALELPKEYVIWEPAAGDGAMMEVVHNAGYKVIAQDLAWAAGEDFLHPDTKHEHDFILTNPPWSLAEEFIVAGCEKMHRGMALLLKATFWNTKGHLALFKKYKPRLVMPLTWRPAFVPERGKSPMLDVLWTVWAREGPSVCLYSPLERPKI